MPRVVSARGWVGGGSGAAGAAATLLTTRRDPPVCVRVSRRYSSVCVCESECGEVIAIATSS